MKLITVGAFVALGLLTLAISTVDAQRSNDGRTIFRFDTFGDEPFWTDVLKMPEALAKVDPKTALSVGLKVDAEALPKQLVEALKKVDRVSASASMDGRTGI